MLPLPLIAAFEQLRLGGTRFICFGDFKQLTPVSNSWRGEPIPPDVFETSRLFKSWCPTAFVLTRCHRSDEETFRFYCSLPGTALLDAKQLARERFPAKVEFCDWNIVISHARRIRINGELQRRFCRGKDVLQIPKFQDPPFPCCVGTRLLGSNNSHKLVFNGGLYTVSQLQESGIVLRDENGQEFPMTAEQVARHTRLSLSLIHI